MELYHSTIFLMYVQSCSKLSNDEGWFAIQSENVLKSVQEHKALISDLQTSKDHTMVITASKDTSAKVSHFYDCNRENTLQRLFLFYSYLMPTNFSYLKHTKQNVQSIQHLYHHSKIM